MFLIRKYLICMIYINCLLIQHNHNNLLSNLHICWFLYFHIFYLGIIQHIQILIRTYQVCIHYMRRMILNHKYGNLNDIQHRFFSRRRIRNYLFPNIQLGNRYDKFRLRNILEFHNWYINYCLVLYILHKCYGKNRKFLFKYFRIFLMGMIFHINCYLRICHYCKINNLSHLLRCMFYNQNGIFNICWFLNLRNIHLNKLSHILLLNCLQTLNIWKYHSLSNDHLKVHYIKHKLCNIIHIFWLLNFRNVFLGKILNIRFRIRIFRIYMMYISFH